MIPLHVKLSGNMLQYMGESEHLEPGMWYMPVMIALRRLRQEDHKYKSQLGCRVQSNKPGL
jgi:hypothetical protein